MLSDDACDAPPFDGKTTDFIGHFWSENLVTIFPVTTSMPLSITSNAGRSHGSQLPSDSGRMTSPSTGSVSTPSEDQGRDPFIEGKDETSSRRHEATSPIETSLHLTPFPGSAPQLSGTSAGRPRAPYSTSSLVRTALPLLMRSDTVNSLSSGTTGPNPLASTLARDSLLIYAHQLFNSFSDSGAPGTASPGHPYNSQLLPLLQRLRTLHLDHLPLLLLLGCVYYAVGDFRESLSVNEEILRIDGHFVSRS